MQPEFVLVEKSHSCADDALFFEYLDSTPVGYYAYSTDIVRYFSTFDESSEPCSAAPTSYWCEALLGASQFYGLGGYMGPDLTNVISTRGEAYSRAFITAGTARMPNFKLQEAEVSALVAYLAFVDQTGTYPPKNYDVLWTGAVAQQDDPR